MLKAPRVVGEGRGTTVFPPLRVAFREQLMQEELVEEEHVQDASVGAGTAGSTCEPSWSTGHCIPSWACFGQLKWFCFGPLAVGSLEAGAAGRGVWGREQGCGHSHSHALSHPWRKEEVTPGSCSPPLPGRSFYHTKTISCVAFAQPADPVVWSGIPEGGACSFQELFSNCSLCPLIKA